MNISELIKTRKSVRTFDRERISDSDIQKISDYCRTITNPYNIPNVINLKQLLNGKENVWNA